MPAKAKQKWCKHDLDFDENGCLYIKNKDLAAEIQAKIDAGAFCITRDDEDVILVDENGDPIGEGRTNMQCPC